MVRVAAVLPDRFSAGLLAAMLERQPAIVDVGTRRSGARGSRSSRMATSCGSGTTCCVRPPDKSLPQSLRRAMERQSASIMLSMGVAPAEVATQLARSAEPGDREAISALRQAAQAVSQSDASAAADLSKRALELMPTDDAEHGRVVAETVVLLNRARRYEESEELAVAALERASAEEEAEIRLRLPAFTRHSSQRASRGESPRTRAGRNQRRHPGTAPGVACLQPDVGRQGWPTPRRGRRGAAEAESIGDLESKVIANLTLACFDCADGYAGRALVNLQDLCALGHTRSARGSSVGGNLLHELAGIGRPAGGRCGAGRRRDAASPAGTQRDGARYLGHD